ncbi:MAG: outer membrane protein assembly factor BamE, partial [Psychrobacter sp.]|nr:outer membrane protein assembly factor BamE [Psychrobacter sp.]
MNMKSLFFSILLASTIMPAANAYESNERRLTYEDIADLSQGMTRESVHSRIGKPVMRTSGAKDTWIYKALTNTDHGVDVCNVSVGFDRNGLLERAFWDEKSCDNSALSQMAPKNPAPTYVPGINDINYPAYDGMLAP